MSCSEELWGHRFMPNNVMFDILLPNGIVMTRIELQRENTLTKIKRDIWPLASQYPLYDLLDKNLDTYVFQSITNDEKLEEFHDENRRLCELKLFSPFMKLVKSHGNKAEKILTSKLDLAISMNVKELDNNVDPEVIDFRQSLLLTCQRCVIERDSGGVEALASYEFPPDIQSHLNPQVSGGSVPGLMSSTNNSSTATNASSRTTHNMGIVKVSVWSLDEKMKRVQHHISLKHSSLPSSVVREAIYQRLQQQSNTTSDTNLSSNNISSKPWRLFTDEEKINFVEKLHSNFVLKVAGFDSYFLEEIPISQYRYIQHCILRGRVPTLVLIQKRRLHQDIMSEYVELKKCHADFHTPSYMRSKSDKHGASAGVDREISTIAPETPYSSDGGVIYSTIMNQTKQRSSTSIVSNPHLSLWRLDSHFMVHVIYAHGLTFPLDSVIFCQVGVFHGDQLLGGLRKTRPTVVSRPKWNEWVVFDDIFYIDLPRAAKLNISLWMAKSSSSSTSNSSRGGVGGLIDTTAGTGSSFSTMTNIIHTQDSSKKFTVGGGDALSSGGSSVSSTPGTSLQSTSHIVSSPLASTHNLITNEAADSSALGSLSSSLVIHPPSLQHHSSFSSQRTPIGSSSLSPSNAATSSVDVMLGYVNIPLFNYQSHLLTKERLFTLYPAPSSSTVLEQQQHGYAIGGLGSIVETTKVLGSNPDHFASLTIENNISSISSSDFVSFPSRSDFIDLHKLTKAREQQEAVSEHNTSTYADDGMMEEVEEDSVAFLEDSVVHTSKSIHIMEDEEFTDDSDNEDVKHRSGVMSKCRDNLKYLRNGKVDIMNTLFNLCERDSLSLLSDDEKDLLWNNRRLCMSRFPNILPRILDSVRWNCRERVAEIYELLDEWPTVSIRIALELLDSRYPDPYVRRKAVSTLSVSLSEEDLHQYMLQLVQALKHEPYLDSPLASFLVCRALKNVKIGNCLFWRLRSEMDACEAARAHRVKFALLLEAYCRSISPHKLNNIIKQIEAIEKLKILCSYLKDKGQESTKDRLRYMDKKLRQTDYLECLQHFTSPLDHSCRLGKLDVEQCRFLDSAKKPLWLVWKNADEIINHLQQHKSDEEKTALTENTVPMFHAILYKSGDDLRQDMLNLQLICVMDKIWRQEGLDLHMTPYSCVSTGHNEGLIEIVRRAKTVYQIQKKAGKLAAIQVDSSPLFKWIKEQNKGEVALSQAVDTFTKSCAGYCVATFILGIGDRHPDNIMVNEDGQIFHIDFGHFLGNVKKKFGITRERVPFVLTEDFMVVIAHGKKNARKSEEFVKFQELCGRAYLSIRRHASLLITLLSMMVNCGIPELESLSNASYIRRTLALHWRSPNTDHWTSYQSSSHNGTHNTSTSHSPSAGTTEQAVSPPLDYGDGGGGVLQSVASSLASSNGAVGGGSGRSSMPIHDEISDERRALSYFQSMFFEAYGGAWTTKLDWFFHSVRH